MKKIYLRFVIFVLALFTAGCAFGVNETPPLVAEPARDSISFLTKDYYTIPQFAEKLQELFFEATGTELEVRHVPPNNWKEKITATFVSGDIPDISRVDNNFYPFVRKGYVTPLDSYIEENQAMKDLLHKNPEVSEPFRFGGSIYGISVTNQKYMCIWVRKDWMNQLNIEPPSSLEAFTDMLRDFKDSGINQNSSEKIIPLVLTSGIKNYDVIAAAFGVRSEIYLKDGKVFEPFLTPEYKDFMDYMRLLYAEELIDSELSTNSSYGNVRAKFQAGAAASIIMWDDSYNSLKTGLAGSGFDLAEVEPLSAFKTERGVFGFSYYQADSPMVITSACKDPKEVFDLFFTWYFTNPDAIISTSLGIDGYNFNVIDGTMVLSPDNGSVGFHGQSLPPIDQGFVFPFNLFENNRVQYDYIISLGQEARQYGEEIYTIPPSPYYIEYYNVKNELDVKIKELFFAYIASEIAYEQYCDMYIHYKDKIGLDRILQHINKT